MVAGTSTTTTEAQTVAVEEAARRLIPVAAIDRHIDEAMDSLEEDA